MKHVNTINHNDQDSANYTVSLRINLWYLHVYLWALDHVVYLLYVVVVFFGNNEIGLEWWKLYTMNQD